MKDKVNTTKIKQKKRPFGRINTENTRKFYNALFIDLGELFIFAGKVIRQFLTPPYESKELIRQCYNIGNKSLGLVSITGFIMGLVLTMQTRPILVMFGAQSLIPSMVSVSVFREIGPVITGLICAGKVSSGIGAEIGAMRVTEQIDAMDVSGTKPLGYVVATRVMAATIMIPLLVLFSNALSLFGSFLAINLYEPMSLQLYTTSAFDLLEFIDVVPPTIKTVFFGFFIGLIGTYSGYRAGRGTESVGLAANSAVVNASLAIFIIDLIAVLITNTISA
ncbi:MAG: MlaE family ABC transporter permease [Paludibacteraceae bacterium]